MTSGTGSCGGFSRGSSVRGTVSSRCTSPRSTARARDPCARRCASSRCSASCAASPIAGPMSAIPGSRGCSSSTSCAARWRSSPRGWPRRSCARTRAPLQAEVDAMAAAAVADDVHATVEHSERFHRLIIEASGNQLLETVWSSLSITDHTALTMVTLSLDLDTLARVASADRRCHRGGRHRAGLPRQPRAPGVVRGDAGRHGRERLAAHVGDLGLTRRTGSAADAAGRLRPAAARRAADGRASARPPRAGPR